MQEIAKMLIRPPFKQTGACHKRGNCCYYILFPKRKGWLGKLHLFWTTEVNGFYFRMKEPVESEKKSIYVMGCRYLQKNGKCGCYFLRPMVCRKWPMIEYFGFPRLLKGCGFKAELRSKSQREHFPLERD
jgi:Fe-S-cluster containining protein